MIRRTLKIKIIVCLEKKKKNDNYESILIDFVSYYWSFNYLKINNFIVYFYNPRALSSIQYSFQNTLIDILK